MVKKQPDRDLDNVYYKNWNDKDGKPIEMGYETRKVHHIKKFNKKNKLNLFTKKKQKYIFTKLLQI
jgi:hypothetical protein